LEPAEIKPYVNKELEKISGKEITGEGAEAALPINEKRQSVDSNIKIDTLKNIESVDEVIQIDGGDVMPSQPSDKVHGVDDENKIILEVKTEIDKGSGAGTKIEGIGMVGTSLQEERQNNEDVRVGDKEIQEITEIKVNDRVDEDIADENPEIKGIMQEAIGGETTNEETNAGNEQLGNTPVIVSQKEMKEETSDENIKVEVDVIEEKAVPIPVPVHTIHDDIQAQTRTDSQIEKEAEKIESLNYFPVYVYHSPPSYPIDDEIQHGNKGQPTTEIDLEIDKETKIVNDTVGIEINGISKEGEKADDAQLIDGQFHVGNKETEFEFQDKEGEITDLQINSIVEEEKGKQLVEEELVSDPSSNRKDSDASSDRRDSDPSRKSSKGDEIKNKRGWKRKKSNSLAVDEKNEQPRIDVDNKERDSTGTPSIDGTPPIETTDSSSLMIHTL
jgi:hypothetical protein